MGFLNSRLMKEGTSKTVRLYSISILLILFLAACDRATPPTSETTLSESSLTLSPPAIFATPSATGDSGTYVFPPLFPPHSPSATYPPLRQWVDVLQFTPYPYSTPLPPAQYTQIDGVYAKYDPSEPQWWNCRRCADFLPAGGNWRLQFDQGIMRFYYEVTGFSSVASYIVHGDRLYLFNDPHCPYDIGEYKWDLEKVALKLEEVKDSCAIHMRALNLTRQAWLSCQPPNIEAAISDHWIKPPGCE